VENKFKINLRTVFLIFFISLSVLRIIQFFVLSDKFWDSSDFRTLYLAQNIFLKRENFYDDHLLKAEWEKIIQSEGIIPVTTPGLPTFPLQYPPWAIPFFIPFHLLSWKSAVTFWAFINICFLAGIIFLTVKLFSNNFNRKTLLELLIFVFAFKGTLPEISVGQPMFVSLFFGFLSLYFARKNKWIKAGIFLGIASLKITLALPFFLFLIIKKGWRTVLTGITMILTLTLIVLITVHNPIALLHTYQTVLRLFHENILSNNPFLLSMYTGIGEFVRFFLPSSSNYLWLFYGPITIVFLLLFQRTPYKTLPHTYQFILIATFSLLITYHMVYDTLVLLPIYFLIPGFSNRWKRLLIIVLLPLFLPTTTFIKHVQLRSNILIDLLCFHNIFLLLILLAILLAYPLYSRPFLPVQKQNLLFKK